MSDIKFDIDDFVKKPVFQKIYEDSKYHYVEKLITNKVEIEDQVRAIRYAFLIFNNDLSKMDSSWSERIKLFDQVYYLLRGIDIDQNLERFEEIWGLDGIDTLTTYYFYLATTGLLSENNIKVQIDLKRFSKSSPSSDAVWGVRLLSDILSSLILLIRKSSSIDINTALSTIEDLKKEQEIYETQYLNNQSVHIQLSKAYDLIGYYHICKILTETALYLTRGYNYEGNLQKTIQRHTRYAFDSLAGNSRVQSICQLVYLTCNRIYSNCIWTQTSGLSSNIQILCQTLNKKGFVDLMPSQQLAIKDHFLDAASSATILQMPTSAGKTLLAEFAILQTKALLPQSKIVYLVPTKALINQVVGDLRSDFEGINLTIEKAIGANELDPSENLFLNSKIDILVATPEKFDLLVRKDHPVTHNVSLLVVDEAHNITDKTRGARLELLLAILKRERPNLRYLLLTPFIPRRENGEIIKDWLASGKNAIPPILVDWKPSDKIFIGLFEEKGVFKSELMANPYDWTVRPGIFENGSPALLSTTPKERLFEFAAINFSAKEKSILFLCQGKGTCDKKALQLYDTLGLEDIKSDNIDLVCRYIQEVVGEETILSKVLKKGIAVHHAGLTEEVKQLIEFLIKNKEVNYICATTTVAQGINFPISTVYFDDTRKGTSKRLTVSEFRNIAGRAGRTLIDNVGKIIFPFNTIKNRQIAENYVKSQAEEISSALVDLILSFDQIVSTFSTTENSIDRATLFDKNESLSSLIQYLVHLLNISKSDLFADELEDLFKDSLGYYMLDNDKKKQFINICKTLYFDLQERTPKGVLKYADKTGFSVPSVLSIMRSKSEFPEISSASSWEPENLFNSADYSSMTSKIEVIAHLREVKLGTDSSSAPFNPELVAKILVEWVNGADLSTLSKIHPYYEKKGKERINEFVNYLTSATFKSSWGMSALEGIVNSKNDDIEDVNSYIPSMIYYGVKNKEAIALRMLGVPRIVADNLAPIIFNNREPKTFEEVRSTINNFSESEWNALKPKKSRLDGADWKKVTNILLS